VQHGKRTHRKNIEKALELWVEGFTHDEIAAELGCSEQTVRAWKKRHRWEERLPEIQLNITAKNNQRIADEILADEADDLKTIVNLKLHAKENIGRQVNGKIEMLSPRDIQTLASALDTMSRRKRIIRKGYDIVTDEQIEKTKTSTDYSDDSVLTDVENIVKRAREKSGNLEDGSA
jgi:transposase